MKKCFKCKKKYPLSGFYRHPQMADGHLNKCKECTKADVIENRNKRIEYYVEYDRKRDLLPHRKEMKKRYLQTEAGKKSRAESSRKYYEMHPERRKANNALNNAVRDGKVVKESCKGCGNEKTHGHHEDYSKPLDVIWLCAACHRQWHVSGPF